MKMSRFNITVNTNMRKRADRTALKFVDWASVEPLMDGIIHLTFKKDGKEIIFLDDAYDANWLVSECDSYIVGRGVLSKVYRSIKD